MVEFLVNLIHANKQGQDPNSLEFLNKNCTYISNSYWFYEGWMESLQDNVDFYTYYAEGVVPSLGDMTQDELIKLCMEVFDINVEER